MSDVVEGAAEAPPSARPNLTTAQMIEKFVALRDKKAAIEKGHKDQLAPFNLVMGQLEAFILDDLNTLGGDSLRTAAGTAFKSVRTSATVKDWTLTFDFIRENDAWDLLERRVSKTAVLETIEASGKPVPGVSVTQETTLNIRRS